MVIHPVFTKIFQFGPKVRTLLLHSFAGYNDNIKIFDVGGFSGDFVTAGKAQEHLLTLTMAVFSASNCCNNR